MTRTKALTGTGGRTADLSLSGRPPKPGSQAVVPAFEDQYREATGAEFFVLFERHVSVSPRVDV